MTQPPRLSCATLHTNDSTTPQDVDGCILEAGHSGPHEFVATNRKHYLWETDWECDCEHCQGAEGDYSDGDYCTVYWEKPDGAEE